jgi:hypothetical protein
MLVAQGGKLVGNKPKPGVSQVNFELPTELLDEAKAFAEARGQSLKYVMTRALRRHMNHPPPLLADPPLPPGEPEPGAPPAPKPAPKPRARKK